MAENEPETSESDLVLAPFKVTEDLQHFVECFGVWPETDQCELVEQLLSKMSHYQHSQINLYLKPMLQRDFITLLPSKFS